MDRDEWFLEGYHWAAQHIWSYIRDTGKEHAKTLFPITRKSAIDHMYGKGIQAAYDQAWGR
jgi:hypothetical protein